MVKKPPRQTVQRILDESLKLLNIFGEPSASTTVIAHALRISPGNLYYHFASKDALLEKHFDDFQKGLSGYLDQAPLVTNIDELSNFFRELFEIIWTYRFFYRDLNHLLSRNEKLEMGAKVLFNQKEQALETILNNFRTLKIISLNEAERSRVITQMMVIFTWWHNHCNALLPRFEYEGPSFENAANVKGVSVLLGVFLPYIKGSHRARLEHIMGTLNTNAEVKPKTATKRKWEPTGVMTDRVKRASGHTVQRILHESLRLLNEKGEPGASTTVMAEALGISPGNLYYHFASKDALLEKHFDDFQMDLSDYLDQAPLVTNLDELSDFFRKLVETIWTYRFFYRDLNHLLSRNRKLEMGAKVLFNQKEQALEKILNNLQDLKIISLNEAECSRVITQMLVILTWWHNHCDVFLPKVGSEVPVVENRANLKGVSVLLSLLLPYTRGDPKAKLEHLMDALNSNAVAKPKTVAKRKIPLSR
ncbi:MAG: TetR/AcrR family transcriptional regulator [Gammaproteobacteria bacterium]|nr:TetR/AcrR family transcriptional regulator [Gammaproteobacteria bacterium]